MLLSRRGIGNILLPIRCHQPSLYAVGPIAILFSLGVSEILPGIIYALTIKVGGSDKRYVNPQITVVGGAIEAEVDAERDGRPCRILGTAVKAYLIYD